MAMCRFHARGLCKNGNTCRFLHEKTLSQPDTTSALSASERLNINPTDGPEDDFTRELAGASVCFGEFGQVIKISLPTDFSLAYMTGFGPDITREEIVDILGGVGFKAESQSIRILPSAAALETKATVKVEDPSFAKKLSDKLKNHHSGITATPIPVSTKRADCKKVHLSWHKAIRIVWLNFGRVDIAKRVSEKFNQGRYICLGQDAIASAPKSNSGQGGQIIHAETNPAAWTVVLILSSDVARNATSKDVEKAITAQEDKPRHIELGKVSYIAKDHKVGMEVRRLLERHGPLESFYLSVTSKGKRVKATALFQDEADARSACSLNNRSLDILGGLKLNVAIVFSVKAKTPTAIFRVLRERLDEESRTWKDKHLAFHIYTDPSNPFTTLKVEGNDPKDVTEARKTLDKIFSGLVLKDGGDIIWNPTFSINGRAYKKLKEIEQNLHVAINRDKTKRTLKFFGPTDKYQQVVHQIGEMLKEQSCSSYEINLRPDQFAEVMHGGFKNIEHALGRDVAALDVIARKITIIGTEEQRATALEILSGKRAVQIHSPSRNIMGSPEPNSNPDCPICFCEVDCPIQASCGHTYCRECFEECCKAAASTSKSDFQVRCQGDEGTCRSIFTVRELKDHLSSSGFESLLESSFNEYTKRNPDAFRYCPTPDCGYIYRCAPAFTANVLDTRVTKFSVFTHTCPNCLESLCHSCHTHHGSYTCAEYKDIASGGYEALAKLKKALNIKDCPKCTTPMEKTEGCNHMTCAGCRAHICWVCMAVFESSGPCYEHMKREHGSIGLGLERFMVE
ncbi:hypothetical protein GQ43DRAFT_425899 [Delitschia confertaspora ATCC 74209]|uniref:Uncharacterized protein n=1 Tax=Delitschia confertaspora ATCC 74209 TaxID=1513339 RepID=A0A9P4JHU7_9PLEO|nr:hypothetical protein GQ43DRAFT_425899 [Delitschia confertaspora ATCC 74209]